MLAVFRRNPLALVLAILLHVGLAVFLILEINWRDPVKPIGGDVKVVQAELVDDQSIGLLPVDPTRVHDSRRP